MRDMETKTALVAEDNPEHYERYAALLSGMGLRVERGATGSSMYCARTGSALLGF